MGNAHIVVDEAHATGIYGPQGRRRVAELGLESKIFARILSFGKSLAVSGGVILTNVLVRDYLLNYARSLIYTSLNYATVIGTDCVLDLMEDGTVDKVGHIPSQEVEISSQLSIKLLDLSSRSSGLDLLEYPPISFHSPRISLTITPRCRRVRSSRL